MTYTIRKTTAQRLDGTYEVLGTVPEAFATWSEATCRAMELEAADRGSTHRGRAIRYDAVPLAQ